METMKRLLTLAAITTLLVSCGGGGGSGTPSSNSVPAAPTDVAAAAGNGQVTITWTVGPDAASYDIYWSTTPGVSPASGTRIPGATSPYTHTDLTNGTTYYYVVTAVSAAGDSPPSAQVSAVPLASPLQPPTGVTATAGNRRATITWNAVQGANSYTIYWSTTTGVTPAGGTAITDVTSPYAHTGLTNGTTYYYVVTAVNDDGESAASSQVSCRPSGPVPPTGIVLTPGNGQLTISWNAVTGATSYNIYWSATAGVTTANGTKITHANSPYTLPGLTNQTAYYFVLTSVFPSGESAASPQATSTPTEMPPPSDPPITFVLPPHLGFIERCEYFSYQINPVSGGAGYPYTFNLGTMGGFPPLGIYVNAGGLVEGTTSSPEGLYTFDICVTDAAFTQQCQQTSITVIAPASPGTPSGPSPADGATGVSTSAALAWAATLHTDIYHVYFGTAYPPPKVAEVTVPSYTPPALKTNTTYYWQVIAAHSMCNLLPPTLSGGPIWSFTTGTSSEGLSISLTSSGCVQTWGHCDPDAFCSCTAQYTMSYAGTVCGPVGSYLLLPQGEELDCGVWHSDGRSCIRESTDPSCTSWSVSVLNSSGLAPGSTYSGDLTVYDLSGNSASVPYSFTCPYCQCPSPCP